MRTQENEGDFPPEIMAMVSEIRNTKANSNCIRFGIPAIGISIASVVEIYRNFKMESLVKAGVDFNQLHGLEGFFWNNSGDFSNGIFISSTVDLGLGAFIGNRISSQCRMAIACGTGILATVLAETAIPIGTPDLKDIPAGIAGVLSYAALSYVGRKISDRYYYNKLFNSINIRTNQDLY